MREESGHQDGCPLETDRRDFLRASGLLAGLAVGALPEVSAAAPRTGTATTASQQEATAALPPYPDDPFLQGSFGPMFLAEGEWGGYPDRSKRQKFRALLDLYPDVLAFDQLVTFKDGTIADSLGYPDQFEKARELDLPATSGWNVNIFVDGSEPSDRYGPIMEAEDWRYPDGTPLESPAGIVGELFSGEPYLQHFEYDTMGTPSVFAPGGLDLTVRSCTDRLQKGYSGFFVDGVGVFRNEGLDFSRWKQAAFRDHLASLPNERLADWGIEDPASFDMRSYIKSKGIAPSDSRNPFNDPVFREYVLHLHLGIDEWFDRFRSAIEERFSDRIQNDEIALYANQFTGHFSHPQSPNVYISDSMDVIYTELFPRVSAPGDLNYKLMRAVGNFSKPVIAKGTGITRQEGPEIPDPTTPNPMFNRFQAAEAYACNARLQLPITRRKGFGIDDSVTHWIGSDGTVSESLREFTDFVWAHERFLTNLESAADVAVTFSLPTAMWRYAPTWNIGVRDTPRLDSFTGTASLLREAGIPYDVVVFGHPRLWDDSEQLDRLSRYDAVVLPAIESITDTQLDTLESYLANGGHVLVSGPTPDRDAFYEPREVSTVFDHDRVVVLGSDPGRAKEQGDPIEESLAETLHSVGIGSRRFPDDPDVAVHQYTQSDPDREIIHLVNYDYDADTDSFDRRTDITIRPETRPDEAVAARYYSPQRRTELDLSRSDGELELTIPALDEWGFVVVTTAPKSFTEGSPDQARSSTTEATELVQGAHRADRKWSNEIEIVKKKAQAAELALDFDAFHKASTAAEAVFDAADETRPVPTVGIDQAHGQPQSQDGDPFGSLRESLPNYEYRELTDWQETALEDFDVLVIPPALHFKGADYDFTSTELNRIESFVENGGSLAIMIRGGAASGIHSLTERFGYEYTLDPIVFPEETERNARSAPVRVDHELTTGITQIWADLAAPIKKYPENATILAEISDEAEAWIHKGGDLRTRENNEPSAAGKPIYAVSQHVDGQVVVLGTHRYLAEPNLRNEDVMSHLLEYLSERSRESPVPTLLELYETGRLRSEPSAPAIVGETPATDPDGDGVYEDVNGDGEFNIVDVNALFQNRNSDAVQNNTGYFDFNGDGSVNIVDVNALFQTSQQ